MVTPEATYVIWYLKLNRLEKDQDIGNNHFIGLDLSYLQVNHGFWGIGNHEDLRPQGSYDTSIR